MQAMEVVSRVTLGLVLIGIGFGAGYLSRPSLDPNYIRLMHDPGHFGDYFYAPNQGWMIIDLQVINKSPGFNR